MSFAFGYTMPLLAIALKSAGASQTQIGISASAPSFAIILTGLASRRFISYIGFKNILFLSMVVLCSGIAILFITKNLYVWFFTRAAIGAINGMLWITLESSLNNLTPEKSKGQIFAFYASATALAFACGSLIPISLEKSASPFLVAAILLSFGTGMCFFVQAPRTLSSRTSFKDIFLSMTSIATEGTMAFAAGLLVSMQITLLPTFNFIESNMMHGKNILSLTLFGGVSAQILIGSISDHWNNCRITLPFSLIGIGVSIIIIPTFYKYVNPNISYFLWGGLSNSLYILALIKVGIKKTGNEIFIFNAALLITYEMGSLTGPITGGFLSDQFGQTALAIISSLTFGVITVISIPSFKRSFLKSEIRPEF
jgi:MFS family permease